MQKKYIESSENWKYKTNHGFIMKKYEKINRNIFLWYHPEDQTYQMRVI